ncbi:MAG: anti-sigma factor antagonist [candidate division Zixibacteria bacterium]|nr:anti-sigma factor antagonist [candidate division Zixibacteria bacterium]
MSDIKISLDHTGPENELTMVRVDGVIDTMTATELEKVINSLLEQKRFYIIIDLAGVDYISSAGWGIFISNIREIRQQGGDIKLARMIPNVYEIFELLEFDSILKAFDSLEEAKTDFKYIGEQSSSPILSKEDRSASSNSNSDSSSATVTTVTEARKTEPVPQEDQEIKPEIPLRERSFDQKIKKVIKSDPFLSISGIKSELKSEKYGGESAGWFKVFWWLYSNNMLSNKSRYRFSKREF